MHYFQKMHIQPKIGNKEACLGHLDTADQVSSFLKSFQYLRPVYALNSNFFHHRVEYEFIQTEKQICNSNQELNKIRIGRKYDSFQSIRIFQPSLNFLNIKVKV